MTEDMVEVTAGQCGKIASELESAARHIRVAERHFRERNVPRVSAHVFAAQGHAHTAQSTLDELAALHASRSRTD